MTSQEGKVYGIKAQEEFAPMNACAPSLPTEAHTKIVQQMLDAVGLPGTFTTSAEEHSLSHLDCILWPQATWPTLYMGS